jgi:hypothetical protein
MTYPYWMNRISVTTCVAPSTSGTCLAIYSTGTVAKGRRWSLFSCYCRAVLPTTAFVVWRLIKTRASFTFTSRSFKFRAGYFLHGLLRMWGRDNLIPYGLVVIRGMDCETRLRLSVDVLWYNCWQRVWGFVWWDFKLVLWRPWGVIYSVSAWFAKYRDFKSRVVIIPLYCITVATGVLSMQCQHDLPSIVTLKAGWLLVSHCTASQLQQECVKVCSFTL